MLNLDPKDKVQYTPEEEQAIAALIANPEAKKGRELWDEKGPEDIFFGLKEKIRRHYLTIQRVRCVYCEAILERGSADIEHFAPKSKHIPFLYEPLNLTCSCPICNGVSKKGKRNTIDGKAVMPYENNTFKYVHPFLDDVDKEIKYRDPFKILFDRKRCTDKGNLTIDMFNWDTAQCKRKRIANLLYWTTDSGRRKMIADILRHKG